MIGEQHIVEVPCDLAGQTPHTVEVVLHDRRILRLRSTCSRATVDRLGGRSCHGLVEKARAVLAGATSETADLFTMDLFTIAEAIGIEEVRSVITTAFQTRERRRPYYQPSFIEAALAARIARQFPQGADIYVGVESGQITVVKWTPPSYQCVTLHILRHLHLLYSDAESTQDRALTATVLQVVPASVLAVAARWRARELPVDLERRVHLLIGTEHR